MNPVIFTLILGPAYSETLNAQEPAIEIRPQNTKGSTRNLPLLEAGKLDLGLLRAQ